MDSSTSTIAEELSLSLKSWPTRNLDIESLPFLISRINEQRGGFRNVSEEGLEDEIRALNAGQLEPESETNEQQEEDSPDPKSRREALVAAREEIIKQIVQAQMESAYALDFVSVLLSKYTPKQAEVSISPFLKQNVPTGSIGTEVVQLSQIPDKQIRDDELVSTGWKLQSLNAVADSLLRSAIKLEKEMSQEAKYWEQVLAVKEKGWSVCRLPREKHILGVRYGFAEAAPDFRDRGLAALRRAENGDIELDLGIRASEPRVLRVQVQLSGKTIASSGSIDQISGDHKSIEASILQARNDIFDEELHHELYREARNLTNRGVRCIGDTIVISQEDDMQITIGLVPRENGISEEPETTMAPSLASMIAIALRILLSHAHRQNLNRRSQPPPPLTERRPPRPIYSILRPILAHLQHHSVQKSTQSFLQQIIGIFSKAGLVLDIKESTNSFDLSAISKAAITSGAPLASTLVSSLSAPLHSSTALNLPSASALASACITLHTRTHVYGTEYKATIDSSLPNSTLSSLPQESHFASVEELETHVLHLLMVDLVDTLERSEGVRRWKAENAHLGTLMSSGEGKKGGKGLTVIVARGRLEIKWTSLGERGSGGSHVWRVDGIEDKEMKDLYDVMRDL
ncbi:RNA polymerase II mediator complex subunit [Schaereria dolodes]|nr:RNA polymerase II mediator complex subunit [Schaereria dolodes]